MSVDISSIVSAIEYEANLSAKPLDWRIQKTERHGKLWSIFVEPSAQNAQLDESLEGAACWWPGPPRGTADVLSVVPEELQINLRYATELVPSSGLLKLYPIRFLDKLAEAWASPFRGPRFAAAFDQLCANDPAEQFAAPNHTLFPELRPGQRDAFRLLRFPFSFLWGPPGTGKTHTLGSMLASFLVTFASSRVLLLSTTNTAVDLALVSVDKSLAQLTTKVSAAAACRESCKRIGSHFLAQHYKGREHLVPRTDELLIQQLAALEATRPDPADVVAYDAWKTRVEELRNLVRVHAKEILRTSRLAAMTCTRGVFSYGDLEEIGRFDLVVFDEASQVGLAHALPFLPLADRVLFAGDPKQLAPIVISDDKEVKRWLGQSAFEHMHAERPNTTTLTEQSRMTRAICHVVSETFYEGRLTVCNKAAADDKWLAERTLKDIPTLGSKPLSCLRINSDGAFHAGYRGYMRDESAELLVAAVQAALEEAAPAEIAILTPYRAQRSVIRRKLAAAKVTKVPVSTVHRAQGSEKRTIFFDPVLGTHQALSDHLINVAISRAKARLVVALSNSDLANPRLAQIHALMTVDGLTAKGVPLAEVLRAQKPAERVGTIVQHKDKQYVFEGFDASKTKVHLRDCASGKARKFVIDVVMPPPRTSENEKNATKSQARDGQPAAQPSITPIPAMPPPSRTDTNSPIPLGKLLRRSIKPESIGNTLVLYNNKEYIFCGFDLLAEHVCLRTPGGVATQMFRREWILAQTASETDDTD